MSPFPFVHSPMVARKKKRNASGIAGKRPRKIGAFTKVGGRATVKARKARFVDAYLACGENGAAAARQVGYTGTTTSNSVAACRMLRDPEVQAMLVKRREELAAQFRLTSEDVLKSLARAIFFDPRKLFNADGSLKQVKDLDDDVALELEGYDFERLDRKGVGRILKSKFDFPKKSAVREQAMKFFGMFAKDKRGYDPEDGLEGSEPIPVAVTIEFKDARRQPRSKS